MQKKSTVVLLIQQRTEVHTHKIAQCLRIGVVLGFAIDFDGDTCHLIENLTGDAQEVM